MQGEKYSFRTNYFSPLISNLQGEKKFKQI